MLKRTTKPAQFEAKPLFGLSLERGRMALYLALIALEAILLAATFIVVGGLYRGEFFLPGTVRLASFIPLLYVVTASYRGAYSIRAISDVDHAFSRMTAAMALALGTFFFALFSMKVSEDFSRFTALTSSLAGFLLILQVRRWVIWFVHRSLGTNPINLLVIEDGGPDISGLPAVYVDAANTGLQPDLNNPEMLDLIGNQFRNADKVIVSCPSERRVAWAKVLRAAGIRGELATPEFQSIGAVGLDRYEDFSSLVVSTGPLGFRQRVIKRTLDLLLTIPAIVLLAPFLAMIAAAIRLQDGGPALFVQRRVGYGNRFFPIYKFRTMCADPDGVEGARSASRDDDRITPFGHFLRRTSIDELPQLYNVLVGDMSLVGPRPHAIRSKAGAKLFWEIDQAYWDRHALKPGLTGLAQVRGFRGSTETEMDLADRLKSDLEYAADWTVGRDMAILLRTLRVIVHRNAF